MFKAHKQQQGGGQPFEDENKKTGTFRDVSSCIENNHVQRTVATTMLVYCLSDTKRVLHSMQHAFFSPFLNKLQPVPITQL